MSQTVLAAFQNHDSTPHTVTVEAVTDDGVVAEEIVDVPAGQTAEIPLRIPHGLGRGDVEIMATPDVEADARAHGVVHDEAINHDAIRHSQSVPISGLEVPPATAVTVFGIVNGFGGAASQLLASSRLGGGEDVSLNKVAAAGALGLGGTIAAAFVLSRN